MWGGGWLPKIKFPIKKFPQNPIGGPCLTLSTPSKCNGLFYLLGVTKGVCVNKFKAYGNYTFLTGKFLLKETFKDLKKQSYQNIHDFTENTQAFHQA